jgi:peroxin-6
MIYIGLPKKKEEKLKIYQAQTRNLSLDGDVNLDNIAGRSHENYSGADIFAVCSLSFTFAMKDYMSSGIVNDVNPKIRVSNRHFQMALEKVYPSLSSQEISNYEDLKKKYTINQN